MTGLGSLPASSLALLDALVCDHAHAGFVLCWRVSVGAGMHERTARRAWARLAAWGLVRLHRGCSGAEHQVQVTALGVALIDARYAAEVAA